MREFSDKLRELMIISSRLLEYPSEEIVKEWKEFVPFLQQSLPDGKKLLNGLTSLLKIDDLPALYVQTFDFNEKHALYLTSHELGDSRKKGIALIELQRLMKELGYEPKEREFVDYIPLLLELLAVTPLDGTMEMLRRRLSYSVYRIIDHLPSSHPYFFLFDWLMEMVLEVPGAKEREFFEKEWEEADLDPLPYPLFYE